MIREKYEREMKVNLRYLRKKKDFGLGGESLVSVFLFHFNSHSKINHNFSGMKVKNLPRIYGSIHVSGKLATYPSPNLTFCPKREVSVNFRFGEG